MRKIGCVFLFLLLGNGVCGQGYEYTFVFLNNNPSKKEIPKASVDSLQQLHLQNIGKLAKEGKLSVAGPFEGGGGMFILNTASSLQAEEWLSTDPAIAADRFQLEVLPWQPHHGNVCLVEETADMVPYTFVRYNTNISKFNVRDAPELFQQHDDYIQQIVKTGNVISEGVFANNDGGILIVNGTIEAEVIMNDPTVNNGIIEPIIKRVWVGEGSFCEK